MASVTIQYSKTTKGTKDKSILVWLFEYYCHPDYLIYLIASG